MTLKFGKGQILWTDRRSQSTYFNNGIHPLSLYAWDALQINL